MDSYYKVNTLSLSLAAVYAGVAAAILTAVWVLHVNRMLQAVAPEVLAASPHRWASEEVSLSYKRALQGKTDYTPYLPPKLDRRYVVVGGCGLVGGDIVLQLLQRGHPPESIRIIDSRGPVRSDMLTGLASKVDYVRANITYTFAVRNAFNKPWPESVAHLPLTVFHTAARINVGERDILVYDRSYSVNVTGTANILSESRRAGADMFIMNSSGTVGALPVKYTIPLWESSPRNAFQTINEKDFDQPIRKHEQFCGNYAHSKAVGERLVCKANEPGFRTGAIRPANVVYGERNDAILGPVLRERKIIAIVPQIIHSWVHSHNVALAHLQFEAALARKDMPPCAGRPFVVTDPNPPPSYKDYYGVLKQLCNGPIAISSPPPVMLMLLSYAIEMWCVMLVRLPFLQLLGLSEPKGDLAQFQPAIYRISGHMVADDRLARKSVEEGGIGYTPVLGTLVGICEEVADWNMENERRDRKL